MKLNEETINNLRDSMSQDEYCELIRLASKYGSTEMVEILLKDMEMKLKEETINNLRDFMSQDEYCKLIKLASKNGCTKIVDWLLKDEKLEMKKLSGDATKSIRAAIFYACENGYTEIFKILISHGAKISDASYHIAAQNKHFDIVKVCIEEFSVNPNYPMSEAIKGNDFEMVEYLLKKGVDASANCALEFAASYGHESIAQLLIDNGANLSDSSDRLHKILIDAIRNGKYAVVELLIKIGVDITANEDEAFSIALKANTKKAILELLLDNGAPKDVRKLLREVSAMYWSCYYTKGDWLYNTLSWALAKRGVKTNL